MFHGIRLILLGMREFRTAWTTSVEPEDQEVYDFGRDLAHRLTLRRFEER